jgi:glyoxylase I family protein
MIANQGLAHIGLPVSNMERSVRFYCDVVGCKLLRADSRYAFLDANGTCVLLCLQNEPVNRPDALDWLHHAFIVSEEALVGIADHLRSHGVAVEETEDRRNGVINGPRVYFRDPDGTRLEFIHMTGYVRE